MIKTLVSLAAALMIGAAAPAAALAAEPVDGGTLRLFWGTLDTTDFHRHTGTISLTHPFAETLTSISKDGSPKGLLAESWTVSEDARVYTFKLREGVKFHNGRVMTAEDVKKNFERIRDKVKGGWLTTAMAQVEAFETPDEHTFVIRLKAPFGPLLNLLAEGWILAPESPGWDDVITHPIGTGPFTFDSWTPQLSLKGTRFKDYWMKGLPHVDAVEFDVREVADASLALRAGDYDAAAIPLNKIATLEKAGFTIDFQGGTSWEFVSFNNRKPRPPFDKVRVREAVAYALDRKELMAIEAGRYGAPGNQPVGEGNYFYDAGMAANDKHNAPDLERARAILKEEGVTPSDYTLTLVSTVGSRSAGPVGQALRALGFGVDNRQYDDLGYQRALSEYDWDIFPGGSGARADIFLRYVRLMSDGPNPGLWGGIQDPELDALIEAAISTPSLEESRADYLKAWQRVMDHYYTIGLGQQPNAYAISPKVHDLTIGFNASAHRVDGGIAFAWIEK